MQRRWLIAGVCAVVLVIAGLAAFTAGPGGAVLSDETTRVLGKRLLASAHPDASYTAARARERQGGPPDGHAFEVEVAYKLRDDAADGQITFGVAVLSTDPCVARATVLGDSGPSPARKLGKSDDLQPAYKALCAALD